MSTIDADLYAGASMSRRGGMVEATPRHKERAMRSLRRHTARTMRQLIAAGACWRAVQELVSEGVVESTPGPGAALVYELAMSEQEA